MALLSESDASEVKKIFGGLKSDVHVKLYTQKLECPSCSDAEAILKELDRLSDKLRIEFLNTRTDSDSAKKDGVDSAPEILVSDGSHSRVKFKGTPSGYEFSSLLTTILDAGSGEEPLTPETREFLDGLQEDLNIQVFVTPTCPHCPGAAVLATRMARYSPRATATVIEANEFPQLSMKYGVQGVPRTVINEDYFAEGALPENMVVKALTQAMEDATEGRVNLMNYLKADQ